MKHILITKYFSQNAEDVIGKAQLQRNEFTEINWHFEPMFKILEKNGNEITKAELVAISLVPNKPTKLIPIAKVWSRKGECPDCYVGTGSKHKVNCIYRKK